MRRWIVIGIGVVALMFVGMRSVISQRGEGYLKEVLAAYNRAGGGAVHLELAEYRGGWSGAKAKVRAQVSALPSGAKESQTLDLRLNYGPLFLSPLRTGLIRIESEGRLSRWLEGKARERYLKNVSKDIGYRYLGVMDWWHMMHERIEIGSFETAIGKGAKRLILTPSQILSDFDLSTLRGHAEFSSERLEIAAGAKGEERLRLLKPRLDARIDEYNATGLTFGSMSIATDEIQAILKRPAPRTYRLGALAEIGLIRRSQRLADLHLEAGVRALDEPTREAWKGLERVKLKLRMESLGIAGLERLKAMQRERARIGRELARAVGVKDDAAMQRAILALQALDDNWIEVYNATLIPGKSRFVVDETLTGKRTSRLHLDLTFVGKKLPKDPFAAMVRLTTGLADIVEGDFSLTMEEELLGRLAPEVKLILERMVSMGLAKLEKGTYRLQGRIEGGKIVINGTRYAPAQLALMILM